MLSVISCVKSQNNINIYHLNTRSSPGLSQNTIYDITQSPEGLVFIGNQRGIDIYLGDDYINLDNNNSSLSSEFYTELTSNKNFTFTINSLGEIYLIYFDDNKFRTKNVTDSISSYNLTDYKLRANKSSNCLLLFNDSKLLVRNISSIDSIDIKLEINFNSDIYDVSVSEQYYTVVTSDSIYIYNFNTHKTINQFSSKSKIIYDTELNNDTLFLLKNNSINYIPIKSTELYSHSIYRFNESNKPKSILIDKSKVWLVYEYKGVVLLNKEYSNGLNLVESNYSNDINKKLSSNNLNSIYRTIDGVVWISTNGSGINMINNRYVNNQFQSLENVDIKDDHVWSISKLGVNKVILSTKSDGIYKYDHSIDKIIGQKQFKTIDVEAYSSAIIGDIIFIGTNNGVYVTDTSLLSLKQISDISKNSKVVKLLPIDNSSVLVLQRLEEYNDRVTTVSIIDQKSLKTTKVLELPDKISCVIKSTYKPLYYLGGDNNIYILDDSFNAIDSVSTNNFQVISMTENDSSQIWIGSDNKGLSLLDINSEQILFQISDYSESASIPFSKIDDDIIYSIESINTDTILFSTSIGIYSLIHNNNYCYTNLYDSRQGNEQWEYNMGSSLVLENKVLFGGTNGITSIQYEQPLLEYYPIFNLARIEYMDSVKFLNDDTLNIKIPTKDDIAIKVKSAFIDYNIPIKSVYWNLNNTALGNVDKELILSSNDKSINGLNRGFNRLSATYFDPINKEVVSNSIDIIIEDGIWRLLDKAIPYLIIFLLFTLLSVVLYLFYIITPRNKRTRWENLAGLASLNSISNLTDKILNDIIYTFNFDYCVLSRIDLTRRCIYSEDLLYRNSFKYNPQKWIGKSRYSLNTEEETDILHYTYFNNIYWRIKNNNVYQIKNVNKWYDVDLTQTFNHLLNTSISNNSIYGHDKLDRMIIPISTSFDMVDRQDNLDNVVVAILEFGICNTNFDWLRNKIRGTYKASELIDMHEYFNYFNYQYSSNYKKSLQTLIDKTLIFSSSDKFEDMCSQLMLSLIVLLDSSMSFIYIGNLNKINLNNVNDIILSSSSFELVFNKVKELVPKNIIYRQQDSEELLKMETIYGKEGFYYSDEESYSYNILIPINFQNTIIGIIGLVSLSSYNPILELKYLVNYMINSSIVSIHSKRIADYNNKLLNPLSVIQDGALTFNSLNRLTYKYLDANFAVLYMRLRNDINVLDVENTDGYDVSNDIIHNVSEYLIEENINSIDEEKLLKLGLINKYITKSNWHLIDIAVDNRNVGYILLSGSDYTNFLLENNYDYFNFMLEKVIGLYTQLQVLTDYNDIISQLGEAPNNYSYILNLIADKFRHLFRASQVIVFTAKAMKIFYKDAIISSEDSSRCFEERKQSNSRVKFAEHVLEVKRLYIFKNFEDYINKTKEFYQNSKISSSFWKDEGIKSSIAIPMTYNDTPLGVVFINYKTQLTEINDYFIKAVESFANIVSTAIHLNEIITKQTQQTKKNAIKSRDYFNDKLATDTSFHQAYHKLRDANNIISEYEDKREHVVGLNERYHLMVEYMDKINLLAFMAYNDLEKYREIVKNISPINKSKIYIKEFIVNKIIPTVQNRLELKRISLDYNINIASHIYIDADKIHDAISNIINNAITFVKNKGIIKIVGNESTDNIIISIIDNGPGLLEGVSEENMYVPYFSKRQNINDTGTGLGLTLAQHYVQQHDGIIKYERKNNKTFFTIILPKNTSNA